MKKIMKLTLLIVILLALFMADIFAAEINKTFKNIKTVNVKSMTGDCVITKSSGSDVTVHITYESHNLFKPKLKQDGDTLHLTNKLGGSECTLEIAVPEKTAIKASCISGNIVIDGLNSVVNAKTVSGSVTAKNCSGSVHLKSVSGDFEVENLKGTITLRATSGGMDVKKISGEIEVSCTSGDVDAEDLDGKIFLKVASGDIDINKIAGELKVKAASGDIKAIGVVLKGESSFQSASGDVNIHLAQTAAFDLNVASASGDAVLNYNGNSVKGFFQLKALKNDGHIVSPFKFDKEEIEEKWGKEYDVKSFSKGGNSPKIYIHTASGKAALKL